VDALLTDVRRGTHYEPRMPHDEAEHRRADWHGALRPLLDA
jgi:hypothetical protein